MKENEPKKEKKKKKKPQHHRLSSLHPTNWLQRAPICLDTDLTMNANTHILVILCFEQWFGQNSLFRGAVKDTKNKNKRLERKEKVCYFHGIKGLIVYLSDKLGS